MRKNDNPSIMPGFDSTDQEEIEEEEEMGVEDWGTLNDDQINPFERSNSNLD